MLFYPWRNEEKEIEIKDTLEKCAENSTLVSENKAKFASMLDEEFDNAQENIEKEIREHYEGLVESYVDRLNEADENLLNNQTDPTNEEPEDELGYRAALQDELSTVQQAAMRSDNDKIQMPKLMQKDDYDNLMMSLNRIQHKYIANFLNMLKTGEKFYHFISGGAGTGKSHLIKAIFQTCTRFYCQNDKN